MGQLPQRKLSASENAKVFAGSNCHYHPSNDIMSLCGVNCEKEYPMNNKQLGVNALPRFIGQSFWMHQAGPPSCIQTCLPIVWNAARRICGNRGAVFVCVFSRN